MTINELFQQNNLGIPQHQNWNPIDLFSSFDRFDIVPKMLSPTETIPIWERQPFEDMAIKTAGTFELPPESIPIEEQGPHTLTDPQPEFPFNKYINTSEIDPRNFKTLEEFVKANMELSGEPPKGYIRIYRGINPERNVIDAKDPTHGAWFTTQYDDAVSYANWDYEGTGELGPNRAIVAVDVPLKDAFEFAKSGSRRKINNAEELLEENPVEMRVSEEVARKAKLYEGSLGEALKGMVGGEQTRQQLTDTWNKANNK